MQLELFGIFKGIGTIRANIVSQDYQYEALPFEQFGTEEKKLPYLENYKDFKL